MTDKKVPDIIRTKGNVQSFGGSKLVANLEKAETAIAKMNYTERIWDRSRSQWALKHLVHSYSSDWKNLRQVSAEMQRKRDALREAKYNYAKKLQEAEIKQAEIEIYQEQLSEGTLSAAEGKKIMAEIRLLEIEIAEIHDGANAGVPKIEGAMKEILTLEKLHDQLLSRMKEIGEEEYEKEEAINHMKHAIDQAIREVRANGRIGTGVQEYLQQCGVNCSAILKDIITYLNGNEEGNEADYGLTSEAHYQLIDLLADKYKDCPLKQAEILGFEEDPITEITYQQERDDR
jgi:chromosome segregation ATPase